jgi:hypothetical protein
MQLLTRIQDSFRARPLTRRRVVCAFAVAVVADSLQWLLLWLGPVGFFLDEIIDVVAMVLTVRVLGFHPLLLPTFVVELLPLVDMLPTWTGCVAAVMALRKHRRLPAASVPETPPATIPRLPPPP